MCQSLCGTLVSLDTNEAVFFFVSDTLYLIPQAIKLDATFEIFCSQAEQASKFPSHSSVSLGLEII
jgi:hypothetical protein